MGGAVAIYTVFLSQGIGSKTPKPLYIDMWGLRLPNNYHTLVII